MKRFLFALAVLGCTGAIAEAGTPVRSFLRCHRPGFVVRPFRPVPFTPPQAMPAAPMPLMTFSVPNPTVFGSPVFPVAERPLPSAIRGLTLLPGSFGGCGPSGCPKLPAGMPR